MSTTTHKNILPTVGELMRFRVIDDTDGSTVIGDIEANNAAFTQALESLYRPSYEKQIERVTQLALGESVIGYFRQSGTTGTYRILRVA